jgi:hypothetical protein
MKRCRKSVGGNLNACTHTIICVGVFSLLTISIHAARKANDGVTCVSMFPTGNILYSGTDV